jgi:GT2 family glycosyltransferase
MNSVREPLPPLPPLPDAPLTAVVVTYNHAPTIQPCLRAVLATAPAGTQVLVLDNASADGTAAAARQVAGVRVVELGRNTGYSAAMNLGVGAANSELVLALGPDVILQPGFFQALIPALGPGVAMATGLMLDLHDPGRIDDAGTVLAPGRQFKSRGAGQPDAGQYPAGDVLAVCGGCCLLRRDAIRDLMLDGELFDEDFFAYKEDVDLGWRAHLLGWTCRFEPAARALHGRQGARGGSPLMWQLSIRNRWLLLLKNEDPSSAALRRNHARSYRLRQAAALVPAMLRKRRLLAARRRVDPVWMRRRLADLRAGRSVGTGKDP